MTDAWRLPHGSLRRAVPFLGALALAAACAEPATAWSDRTHALLTGEAAARLPEPLRDLLAGETALRRLQDASAAPDSWRKPDSPHYRPDEKPRHFFNIDAVAGEPYPFASFPRERQAAVERFGAETFETHGTAPWAAADALARLADALAQGRPDDVFTAGGELAHYATDLHMPLHATANYDGQATGNHGVHKAVEVGLIHRHLDRYAAEVRAGRREVAFRPDPTADLFDWLIAAYARAAPILEADTAARSQANYNPAQHPEDLDDPASARARRYYETLGRELAARGLPEAAALRDAAEHLADLFYTAWVRAGRPAALAPPPAREKTMPSVSHWLVGAAVAMLILLLLPRPRRRRPRPTDSS